MRNERLDTKTIEDYFAQPDIHDERREDARGIVTLFVAAVTCALESLLVYGLVNEQMSVITALVLHAIMVAVLMIYKRVMMDNGGESRFAMLLVLTTALIGPFGGAGVMLTILLYWWFSLRSIPFWEWFQSIFPPLPQTAALRIYDNIVTGRDESVKSYSVISFIDVISFGNESQKRQALAKMTSNFNPQFAPAFKKALEDKSNMIRVQAATAITKIETQFLNRLMQLSKVHAEHPNDPVVILAIARHYDDYAYTGLLDIDREQSNRRKALEYYQVYLNMRPRDTAVDTYIGRILMREKNYEKACEWFRNCIERGHHTQMISQWYSEALFASGRFEELRQYRAAQPLVQESHSGAIRPDVMAAMELWSGARA